MSSNIVNLPPRPRSLVTSGPDMTAAGQAGVQASFAVVKYGQSQWAVQHRGETKAVLTGDGGRALYLDVVIVGVAQGISKQFYAKRWEKGQEGTPPDCQSVDGITPDPGVPNKQSPTCAACPNNVWGSKINDNGKKVRACDDRRRLALVPYGDMENATYGGPMLLALPPTSLKNFANYCGELQRHGAQPYHVRSKASFDPNATHPVITWTAAGWLTDEEAEQAMEMVGHPNIDRMLKQAVAGVTTDPEVGSALAVGRPPAIAAPKAPPEAEPVVVVTPDPKPLPPATAAEPVPEAEDEEEALAKRMAELKARKAAAKVEAAKAAAPKAATQVVEAKAEAPKPEAAKPAPVKTIQAAPADLEQAIDSLLAG
jgi:hypothetical protein